MGQKRVQEIKLSDFVYDLPEGKIAKYPLVEREQSKLLVYKEGSIQHSQFYQLHDHIPAGANLFFNDTRVIPARLHFKKETGAAIEIFLLEPLSPTTDIARAMLVKHDCQWKCMVGNLKKWKNDQTLVLSLQNGVELKAKISDREHQIIEFAWNTSHTFVDILQESGKIPLPPYINREVNEMDKERYQTVYSHHQGAVAAPTAGLHFSDVIIEKLKSNNVSINYLTLHVSAGTFQPIREQDALRHPMHAEQVIVSIDNISAVLKNSYIITVGTTAMRTLESLYWFGVKLLFTDETDFFIHKMFPYAFEKEKLPSTDEAMKAVKQYMLEHQLKRLSGTTEIFIFPGYEFKVCRGLITNYHLPGSTLILLVAAFIGTDWKKVYQEALHNDYRFLSYGDSSLLLP